MEEAQGECTIADFPSPGETAHFRWEESTQHLELVGGDEPDGNELFVDDFSGGNLDKWTAERGSSSGSLSVADGVLR